MHDLKARSVLDIQIEYTYIQSNLAIASTKANDLLRQIPMLEQSLTRHTSSREVRKNKKQLGWVKSRLAEATRQEQILLQRLGHVAWEIQQRQRQLLLDEERRSLGHSSCSPSLSSTTSCSTLDPKAPEFHPPAGSKQSWEAPGMRSAHIPWQAHAKFKAPRRRFRGSTLDDVIEEARLVSIAGVLDPMSSDFSKTGLHIQMEIQSEVESLEGDGERQNYDVQSPTIVHRSSSTGDLFAGWVSSRRNSLPSPSDLRQFADCEGNI